MTLVVAVAYNAPIWAHPRAPESAATLRRWVCTVVEPAQVGERFGLAPAGAILAAVDSRLDG